MRDDEKYQRRHFWMRTWKGERALNGELLNDFVCIVEGEIVGRISEQETGPMRGTYKWDGGHSRRIRVNVLPQGGYAPDVHEAARKVEDHYDMVREAAGLPPVVGVRVATNMPIEVGEAATVDEVAVDP